MPKGDVNMPLGFKLYGMQKARKEILEVIGDWKEDRADYAVQAKDIRKGKKSCLDAKGMVEMYSGDIADAEKILNWLEKGELKKILQKLGKMDSLPRDIIYEAMEHVTTFRRLIREEERP